VLTVRGEKLTRHRRFTPNALREIDTLLREGPFNDITWGITDQQGSHTGADLNAILKNVIWHSVQSFSFSCVDLPTLSYLFVRLHDRISVTWNSVPENRQPVELTFNRLVDYIEHLPAKWGRRSAFVDSLPEGQQQAKAWWNPLRPPRSMVDWIVITLLGGIAVTVVGMLITVLLA